MSIMAHFGSLGGPFGWCTRMTLVWYDLGSRFKQMQSLKDCSVSLHDMLALSLMPVRHPMAHTHHIHPWAHYTVILNDSMTQGDAVSHKSAITFSTLSRLSLHMYFLKSSTTWKRVCISQHICTSLRNPPFSFKLPDSRGSISWTAFGSNLRHSNHGYWIASDCKLWLQISPRKDWGSVSYICP